MDKEVAIGIIQRRKKMSREIKFRIWDKEKKEMIPYTRVTSIQFWTDRVNIFARGCLFFKDIELMQYTGFKDKNGKEIYEGDIVELYDEDDFFKVEYQAEDARFILTTNTIVTDFGYYSHGEIEIVGNLCENPELT